MRRIVLGLALLTLACKGAGGSSQDIVLVQVDAPGLTGITHLNVTFTNAGTSATRSYPANATSAPIVLPTTLSATMPTSRTGNIDVSIDGLDAQNRMVARGQASKNLVSGGQIEITVTLAAATLGPDAGAGGQGGAAGTGGGAAGTSGGTGGAGGVKGGTTSAGGGAAGTSGGTGGAGGVKGGTTSAGGGSSTGTGGAATVGGSAAGIDAGVGGASGGSAGTSAGAGHGGGGSSGTGAAGGSGGAIVTGGVGAGGSGGGTGGTSPCTPIACPALACVGATQPSPDPCGCPICAPSLDGGVAKDAGGSGDGAATDANSTETAATCSPPKSTGGIACPGHFCTVGTYSGYDYVFPDPSGKSSICLAANSLCVAGTTGVFDPPAYTVWGAGFGFSLSPLNTPVQLSGTGVTVALTSLPTGAGLTVNVMDYCAVITAATQTIPWTSFNTICSDPTTGVALTGPPNTSDIGFRVLSGPTVRTFDFCVTALSFQ